MFCVIETRRGVIPDCARAVDLRVEHEGDHIVSVTVWGKEAYIECNDFPVSSIPPSTGSMMVYERCDDGWLDVLVPVDRITRQDISRALEGMGVSPVIFIE